MALKRKAPINDLAHDPSDKNQRTKLRRLSPQNETTSQTREDSPYSTSSSSSAIVDEPMDAQAQATGLASQDGSDDSDGDEIISSEPLPQRVALPSRTKPSITKPVLSNASPTVNEISAPPLTDFASLDIAPNLVRSLKTMSIRRPTPVQAACIPPLLAGQDCIGNAKTGSGKTVAFAIPILQKLSNDPYGIFALILTPTRELAFQISEQFAVLGSSLNIRTSVIVGGMDMMAQAIELRNRPHVVVATPGRLVDLMNSGSGEWSLQRVKFLVLDEADRLLTSTFASDLKTIFAALPTDRQTGLFTATLTPTIENLATSTPRPGKQKPVIYRDVSTVETVETLKQHYILVPSHVREVYLHYLLSHPPESILHLRRDVPEPVKKPRKGARLQETSHKKKATTDAGSDLDDPTAPPKPPPPTIIFTRHPHTASYLTTLLQHLGYRATALHSHLSQPARLASLQLFRASVVQILVCTDVASRGLDMEGVGLVINWDMPVGSQWSKERKKKRKAANDKKTKGKVKADANDEQGANDEEEEESEEDDVGGAEEYVHRVGRTARMGKGGVAVSFVTERKEDVDMVQKIEERIRTKLTEYTMPEEKVLEKLNLVSTAKRTANMEVQESNFGKRQELNRIKKRIRERDS